MATIGTFGAASQADAALYYYRDYDSAYYDQPVPQIQPRRQKMRKPAAKAASPEKDTSAKPQGPLIIAVSIQNQRVRVFDGNGLFAESPVSSGMKGHSTPMGVFSIIQKHKFHHSNIYSNAPMPYMQRITWSGVAMHAGVLPGYPASHGCIRMPTAFAIKMWNWTKMGARVIVTPGEITPTSFSHPLLFTQRVIAQPVATEQPKVDVPIGVKGDKGADAGSGAGTNLELRASVGHTEAQTALREQTRTADASATLSVASTSGTIADLAEPPATAKPTPADGVTGEVKTAEAEPKPETTASTDAPKVEPAQAVEPQAAEKPADPVRAADTPADEARKDPSRLPGVAKPEIPKRSGQIAVLISRKDSKLYVRQNFAPLFEVPVVIAPGERPLGTHIFTAEADKSDPNLLRWSVVSLPTTARAAARAEDDGYPSRRRRSLTAPVEAKPLPSVDGPAEALDRITIPPDAMARIAEAITTGASIIVSDQGINQGETGEGTDFIIPLR